MTLTADGTASYQGCTQTAGEADCTAADRKITGALTVKTGGKISVTVSIHPGVEVPGYAFRASNGSYLIAVGEPDGNGITLLTRSAPSTLPTAGSTRKVWEAFGTSRLDMPDAFVGESIGAFDVNFTSVNNATSTLTTANGQILTLNKLLPGMFYRLAGSNGSNNWPEAIGLDVPGVLAVIGMNEVNSSSFGISLLRP